MVDQKMLFDKIIPNFEQQLNVNMIKPGNGVPG